MHWETHTRTDTILRMFWLLGHARGRSRSETSGEHENTASFCSSITYSIQNNENSSLHIKRASTLTYIITTVQLNSQDGGFSWYAQEHFILTQVRKVTYVLISFVFLPHVTQVHGCAVTRWFPVEIQCKNPLLTRRQRGMWGRNCT